jgi:hypothetical protein
MPSSLRVTSTASLFMARLSSAAAAAIWASFVAGRRVTSASSWQFGVISVASV